MLSAYYVHAPSNHVESSDLSIWLDSLSDENEILTDYGEAFVFEQCSSNAMYAFFVESGIDME